MCQHLGNNQAIAADHSAACGPDALFAIRRQGDVARARVAAVKGPFRLAVTDDEEAWCRHGDGGGGEEGGRRQRRGGGEDGGNGNEKRQLAR